MIPQPCEIPMWAEQFLDGERPANYTVKSIFPISLLLPELLPPSFPPRVAHSTAIPECLPHCKQCEYWGCSANKARIPALSELTFQRGRQTLTYESHSHAVTPVPGPRGRNVKSHRRGPGPRGSWGRLPWEVMLQRTPGR